MPEGGSIMKLKERVAVITGAGGDIGRGTARLFAAEGAKVVVSDINGKTGQETVNIIKADGGEAVFVEADVAQVSDTEKLVKTTVQTFGTIDVLFNNAGVLVMKSLHEQTEEDYAAVVDVCLKGTFFCSRYALPEMMKQGEGCIINMGSAAGLIGYLEAPGYCAAKGGIVNLTRQIALDYAPYNIRCNCICPGAVNTEMMKQARILIPETVNRNISFHPMGRIAEVEEVAKAALFLASDDASFITGVSLPVDGGYLSGKT
jgi:NAD(P)-dependent dehydrogenase (short-subunit alcohol dehydrogenase family)